MRMEQQREIERLLEEAEELDREREQEMASQLEAQKNGSAVEVQMTAILSLASRTIKLKKRDSKIKLDLRDTRRDAALLPPTRDAPVPNSGLLSTAAIKKERRLSFGRMRSDEPDLVRIGRQLLLDKYTQAKKEDQERWNKFVIGFTMAIPVSDKQTRVLGRIKTYRKW